MQLSNVQKERMMKLDKLWATVYGNQGACEASVLSHPIESTLRDLIYKCNEPSRVYFEGEVISADAFYSIIIGRVTSLIRTEIQAALEKGPDMGQYLSDTRIQEIRCAILNDVPTLVSQAIQSLIMNGNMCAKIDFYPTNNSWY